ncbi:MAG: hypothetical protein ACSNEK_07910 [Parachlamydiaceae bacterium]
MIARTDAESAGYLRSDTDEVDRDFIISERSPGGFYAIKNGIKYAIARALAYVPYCDLLWCETSKPDLKEAEEFAQRVYQKYPGKWLAYNCSPSFNWSHFSESELKNFQNQLADMGYKFQFITLAGFHALNASMFELAADYAKEGMVAYSRVQHREFELEKQHGYRAIKHQSFVGAGYFDAISE